VAAVGADRSGIEGLARAERAGIPTFTAPLGDYPTRAAWDRALAESVSSFDPDLVVSAGFMKLVGPAFLDRFGGRFINTHPSLLPAFAGMHAVRDALDYGVKVTGCTVFMVDAGTDTGPVIAQAAVPVRDDDDVPALHERVKVAERALLVDTVGAMARGGWSVQGREVKVGR
jgi:formyltetrahydrofolate-dependent phosphoribosylglycinamide formyltransferase